MRNDHSEIKCIDVKKVDSQSSNSGQFSRNSRSEGAVLDYAWLVNVN